MFKIQTLNKISTKGLDLFPRDSFEVASEIVNPDAILVRSQKMLDMEFPASLKAIARAGAGVNNIPVERCTEKGIVVFNTPGANANSVKELVLAALFLSSRRIFKGITWAKSLQGRGDEIPKLVEEEKSKFEGPEIKGKKLGIVGLGAIGVMVANDAVALGMTVAGYDPFISVESAWGLSRQVKRARSLDSLLSDSDYITLHVPLDQKTKGMISKEKFGIMKKGVRLINLARGGLVNNEDLIQAIKAGIVERYVTDFPEEDILPYDQVLPIPHLGASTPEAEENCAIMAVEQLKSFLENGNVVNSVNFPTCEMERNRKCSRLTVANKNIPNMVGQITTILAAGKINIADMLNRAKGDYAYNIIDVEGTIGPEVMKSLLGIEGVIMARLLNHTEPSDQA